MTDQHTFRSVLRGYDPAEVDPHIATLRHSLEASRAETAQTAVELSKVQSAHLSAAQVVDAHARRIAALEAEAAKSDDALPTYEHLGKRVGSMLTLAEAEANDLRAKAKAETDKLQADTKAHVEALRSTAERDAADAVTKAEADATARISDAKRQADDILDHADREATARREEAEAVYEHQQALATAAAADFEKTLQERRQKSAAEFAADETLAFPKHLQHQFIDKGQRKHHRAQRHAQLRNPQRCGVIAGRDVIKLQRLPGQLATVIGQQQPQQRCQPQAPQLKKPPRALAKPVQHQCHPDVFTLFEGVRQRQKTGTRHQVTGVRIDATHVKTQLSADDRQQHHAQQPDHTQRRQTGRTVVHGV